MGESVHAPIHMNSPYKQTIYIWYYITWTPSLANRPLQTKTILPNTTWPIALSTFPSSIRIITKIEHSAATSRSRPLSRLICRRKPRHWLQQFCMVQWFLLDSIQGFWLDLTQVFLTRSNLRFFTRPESVFPDLIQPNVFDWIRLSFPTWFYSQFSTVFDSGFKIRFDSRLTRSLLIQVTVSYAHNSQASVVPHYLGYVQDNLTLKS